MVIKMDEKGKYITGVLMFIFALALFFGGKYIIPIPQNCIGWVNLLPTCWGSILGSFILSIVFVILAVWTIMFAMMVFAFSAEKTGWIILLYFSLTLTIINLLIWDPIPFVDELVGIAISGLAGVKMFVRK